MNLKIYANNGAGNEKTASNHTNKTYIEDNADSFYKQLEEACNVLLPIHQRYDFMRGVFARCVEQKVRDCQIAFVGLFSKLNHCIRECDVPYPVAQLLHQSRKEMFPELNRRKDTEEGLLEKNFQHNLKATTLLVHHLYGKAEIPDALRAFFPKADRRKGWGSFDENVLRVVVDRWDENFIWVTEEENGEQLQVCYGPENTILSRDGKGSWEYLQQILWEGAQMNLVRIRKQGHGEICFPELIILEPDFLINITTIAGCFETYAESPFVNIISKIKPQANSKAIHLGNIAGQFLDDTVHERKVSFEEGLRKFISRNALAMIACNELSSKEGFGAFVQDAQAQKINIEKLIGVDLPGVIGNYNKEKVLLEPTFFSEILGIQGRFDFLYEEAGNINIIEQKSGKGEFVPYSSPSYNPDIPEAKEQHMVQAILYRALYQYEFQTFANEVHMMLMYSKYSKGLLSIPPMPELLLRAIKMRNLLAWSEILYAKQGMDILATLTPEKLNQKGATGRLWKEYTQPELSDLLNPIHNASEVERLYFLRFMKFLENEQLLSKVGNKMKENSGFASIWHDTLEDKKAAGNIYDDMVIVDYGMEDNMVTHVTLTFKEPVTADTSNFRTGDIVLLYPYRNGEVPNACAQMVNRASIAEIRTDSIVLRLRNSQTDPKVFERKEDMLWAMEHDMFDSLTSGLYSAMHSFLTASKSRRDLLMAKREPEIDLQIKRKGDYGNFNTLVERSKQARDIFLVIGPPGTGKTSHGLVNILNEELLEENSSVLLMSYTNRAVDEICSKLVEIRESNPLFSFIRIGSELSCADEYKDFLLSSMTKDINTGNGVKQLIRQTRVFCGTTSAINANISLLKIKHFSLAIVDESSQILEPHLIGLISAHNNNEEAIGRFVFIGDHKQLPAVVQQTPEESAVTEPLLNDIHLTDCRLSLFERLLKMFRKDDGYDEKLVYMLTKQGRMHKEIAEFPNIAFYDNKLDVVPLQHQLLPSTEVKDSKGMAKDGNGIKRMLNAHRLTFVAAENPKLSPSAKTNDVEAEMIAATVFQIYNMNRESFQKEKTVGVIVPYRNQISTIRIAIDRYGIDILHNITIDTVERYQGSQRDYIIYGFTVQQPYQLNFLTNNVFEENGQIIDRKLNVAMTRARLNLILIGNPTLLERNITFRRMIDFTKQQNAFFNVPLTDFCKGMF